MKKEYVIAAVVIAVVLAVVGYYFLKKKSPESKSGIPVAGDVGLQHKMDNQGKADSLIANLNKFNTAENDPSVTDFRKRMDAMGYKLVYGKTINKQGKTVNWDYVNK